MAAESQAPADELAVLLAQVRERVRSGQPAGDGAKPVLPDLMPFFHARDEAEAKVAAIGTVNPRPPGLANNLIQFFKSRVARGLGWFVRDQVEFNRSVMNCMSALLEALNDSNRALSAMSSRVAAAEQQESEFKDICSHWYRWREEWENKLLRNEAHFLRSVAELHAGFQARFTVSEASFRDTVKGQHAEFQQAVDRAIREVQQQVWSDLERIRLDYERLIHEELRVLRQKTLASAPAGLALPPVPPAAREAAAQFDYTRFAERFRGGEEYVRTNQRFYRGLFEGRENVLDIGCGRGEFLDLMKEAGVRAKGVDLDANSVAQCRAKGHDAEAADMFEYLASLPDADLDGLFCSQVIEHLSPERIPVLIQLAGAKVRAGGVVAFETPNPECLAIFATHFYLDPTHTRPVPPGLLTFYLEEFGFGRIEIHRLAPAVDSMPEVAELPAGFRNRFFGGLDYSATARKL